MKRDDVHLKLYGKGARVRYRPDPHDSTVGVVTAIEDEYQEVTWDDGPITVEHVDDLRKSETP